MCGILGIVKKEKGSVPQARIDAMLASLSRRGPDDRGTMEFDRCLLGQTRLSIIDLSGGHQPMQDNTHGAAITFNGEIYNYRELKRELEERGHTFSTSSDTEVILKAYQEYGNSCVDRLDGMFAFAIWDEEKQQLFLARDRFGKKPLYYAWTPDGNMVFASEIKALFAYGTIRGEIDPIAIDNYLALMYIPPHKTVYKNIFTLGPAEYAVYRNATLEKTHYWELPEMHLTPSYDEAKEEIRKLLTEAVRKRLIADVEIGSFLSGGVDSTLITAYAQKLSTQPLKTFSLGYGNYRNELPYAKAAAEKIGTEQHTLQADKTDLDALHECIAYFDEPHADSSNFPQSLLSKFAASKVKVALSGDGADELFMGYGWYTKHLNLSYRKHLVEKLFLDPYQGYIRNISVFSIAERKKLWGAKRGNVRSFIPENSGTEITDPIKKINVFDLTTYLPGQLLTKIDMTSMMHGLEVRSPFLDRSLAEYVYNLPIAFKMNKSETKIVLKELLTEFMPHDFVYRKKQGFGAPVAEWLRTPELAAEVQSKLGDEALIYSFLQKDAVKNIVDRFYGTREETSLNYKVWVLFCLELWIEAHKDVIQFP